MTNKMKKTGAVLMALILATSVAMAVIFAGADEANAARSNSGKIRIEEIEYDPEDREVSIDFYGKVRYKNVKVSITDGNGKNYTRYISELDDDEIEVKVKKLRYGKKYNYKISGIKKRGSSKYKTISGTFRAIDR